jgi:hypothetical protein
MLRCPSSMNPSSPVKSVKRRPCVGSFSPTLKPADVPQEVELPKDLPQEAELLKDVPQEAEVEHAVACTPVLTEEMRALLGTNFAKCVKGYHLINDDPIKETPWEDINTVILNASGCSVHSKSNGSHQSGGDISCTLGSFSNKSTQYEKGNQAFKISSYRLTTVCSDKEPGQIESIIGEINRRKNFNYYSIIVREDVGNEILYEWYLIPSDFPAFDPATYQWTPKLGKVGKNKGVVTGWESNVVHGSSMSITFSMSSQLWMDISITEEMKSFIIGSSRVQRGKK